MAIAVVGREGTGTFSVVQLRALKKRKRVGKEGTEWSLTHSCKRARFDAGLWNILLSAPSTHRPYVCKQYVLSFSALAGTYL